MTTVVIAPSNVANYPDGGGHLWVYLQYVQGLRKLGCDVYWLERFDASGDPAGDEYQLTVFMERMRDFGLAGRVILHDGIRVISPDSTAASAELPGPEQAGRIFRRAGLLLNFCYSMGPSLLEQFSTTALVDIDPGLLQFWISEKQIEVAAHDHYFTTGETVGQPDARIPDCGIHWHQIRPIVSIDDWPFSYTPEAAHFTTISGWWGGGEEGEWITNGEEICFENNKRVSFLQFLDLPDRSGPVFELALCLGSGDTRNDGAAKDSVNDGGASLTDYRGDDVDRRLLEDHGWRIRQAADVASTPHLYQHYIQNSRGEFSCAKPSCMWFQNAWVSDRSLCYLASGKPVIVQNTGPSSYLPDAEGIFRFSTPDDVASAVETVKKDYRRQAEAARELAAELFAADKVLAQVLDVVR